MADGSSRKKAAGVAPGRFRMDDQTVNFVTQKSCWLQKLVA
jgi:hypothetical protein